MPIVRTWVRLLLVAGLHLTGCSSAPSTNPDDYVGKYLFMPADAKPGEFASFVILKRDHTAIEARYNGPAGKISTTEKKWYLRHNTGEDVVIGQRSYPIEPSGSRIKLYINYDLGQYYEKVP